MKSKIKIANNLIQSKNGIYEGTIVSIGFGEGKRTTKTGRDVEEIIYPRFELVAEFIGTGEPIRIKTFTGTSINSVPVEILYSGRGKANEVAVYNRFTTLLLKLGMLSENDLASVTAEAVEKIEKDIIELKGRTVKCAIGKDKNGYFAIDFNTLEVK